MLVTYFPPIRPDETLYSVICRYRIHTGNLSWLNSYTELFGYKDVKSLLIDFPTKIDEISKRIPSSWGITEEFLIRNCTLFPLYRPFMNGEFAEEIKDIMCSRKEGLIINKMGLRLQRESAIFYCTECAKEDLIKYGETFIRRLHQVPGVMVCPSHNTYLNKVERIAEKQELRYITSLDIKKPAPVNNQLGDREYKLLRDIASDISWLLTSEQVNTDLTNLLEKYKILLKHKGFYFRTGKLKSKKLVSSLEDFYGSSLLEILDLQYTYSKSHWLPKLIYANNLNLFPIRHVLLMRFLSGSVEQFFKEDISQINEEAPFGNGPWYCLNPAAPHYKERVIKNVEIHFKSTDNFSGTFICDCGFIYTRRGPFINEDDEQRIGIVRQYGPVWESKLLRLINEGRTMKYMREELWIGIDALKSAIANLEIKTDMTKKYSPPISKSGRKVFSIVEFRNKYRNKIQELLEVTPNLSVEEILEKESHAYLWLKQHDEEWLKGILIPLRKGNRKSNKEEEDNEIFEKVSVILRNWDTGGNRPLRVTKRYICQLLNLPQRYVSRFPNTNKLIKDALEPKRDYLIRVVDWVIFKLEDGAREAINEEDIYPQIPVKYPQKWLVEYVQKRLRINSEL